MPICCAIGPCTISRGATGWVVAWIECRLKQGSSIASTAVTSTGMCSARQPAITALTAICSTVATPSRGGTAPMTSPAARPEPATMRATASAVGAMTGKPSLQPRSKNQPCSAVGSAGASTRAAGGGAAAAAGIGDLASAVSRLSCMAATRSATCVSFRPPSGCLKTAMRASGSASARASCSALG